MSGTNLFVPISTTCWVALTEAENSIGSDQLVLFAKCTGTPPTTVNVFEHGCVMIRTDSGTGVPAMFQNTGTAAAPVWTSITTSLGGVLAIGPNYIASETGANNAIAGALVDPSGSNVALSAGLMVTIKLAHSLQAGANTFALNGGTAKAIKSHNNPASDVAVAYVSGGLITLMYDGTLWQDMSQ